MKYKSVSTIAAILCGILLFFAASLTAFAQNGVRTAEFELIPSADAVDAFASTGGGIFHFSFATGKTEWVPFGKPANIQDLAELAMRERNPEKGTAGLDFSMMGEIDMRKTPVMILSESEIKSVLSTGKLPEKDAMKKPQHMSPDSWYILKDETDLSFYVFRLKDHSPGYVWQQLAYVRIPDGTSWKANPDLTALLNMPKADAAANSKKKTNADLTRQKIQQAWDKQEAERKQAEKQAEQDALNKRIEDVKQQSAGETFPKTPEEIKLVEDLIVSAKYEDLLKLCEGKKLDFNVEGRHNLLYDSIEKYPKYRTQSFLENKNKIIEYLLENGCRPVLSTATGLNCMFYAIITNNKDAFFLLLKHGFDLNMTKDGKTVCDYVIDFLESDKIDSEIANKLRESKLSLVSMVSLNDFDGVKKALQNIENQKSINKKDENGKVLIEYAIQLKQESNIDMVRLLLDAGALLDEAILDTIIFLKKNELLSVVWVFYRDRLTKDQWMEVFLSTVRHKNMDAFFFFLEQGFDPQEKNKNGKSAITSIYSSGPKEMVDIMDQRGIKKPFWAAVRWNDLDLIKEYLAAGVDVNASKSVSDSPPITIAAWNNYYELAELLLQHGVYVSPEQYYNNNNLYPVATIANRDNSANMMDLLLKYGFVPDFPKTPGDTKHASESSALYMALCGKQYETAKILLKYGARTDVTQKQNVWDKSTQTVIKKDLGLNEIFQYDPEALKVLGARKRNL